MALMSRQSAETMIGSCCTRVVIEQAAEASSTHRQARLPQCSGRNRLARLNADRSLSKHGLELGAKRHVVCLGEAMTLFRAKLAMRRFTSARCASVTDTPSGTICGTPSVSAGPATKHRQATAGNTRSYGSRWLM